MCLQIVRFLQQKSPIKTLFWHLFWYHKGLFWHVHRSLVKRQKRCLHIIRFRFQVSFTKQLFQNSRFESFRPALVSNSSFLVSHSSFLVSHMSLLAVPYVSFDQTFVNTDLFANVFCSQKCRARLLKDKKKALWQRHRVLEKTELESILWLFCNLQGSFAEM